MGARWGINRTVAQIHALLHLSEESLSADAIAAALGSPARTSAPACASCRAGASSAPSTSSATAAIHFESTKNVWELFRTIVDQRKRREIDPTLETLRNALDELDGANRATAIPASASRSCSSSSRR